MANQILTGKVVSNKMQKTVVVEITRRIEHPMYKKYIKVRSRIKADTGEFVLAEGDEVVIESTRPISRTKFFKVVKKIEDNKKEVKTTTPKKTKGGVKSSVK